MANIETISLTEKYREHCEDRVDVICAGQRSVIVVADGAGGSGAGDLAAVTVVHEVRTHFETIHSADDWADLLRQTDNRIGLGETTAVVVDIRPYGIAGASVGDSQAWIIDDGEITDLTQHQRRKPLLGSGECQPVGFTHSALVGVLLVATDGLFDYAKSAQIARLVERSEFFELTRRCVELVRLPSGELWDDVGIVTARNKSVRRPRIRYGI
ncbi:MAG: hypothetical protein Aurels2KO_40580 [Aureliella sp.]